MAQKYQLQTIEDVVALAEVSAMADRMRDIGGSIEFLRGLVSKREHDRETRSRVDRVRGGARGARGVRG